MPPEKENQKRSPGKGPGHLFDIFDEDAPTSTSTTTITTTTTNSNDNTAQSTSVGSMPAVVSTEPATPTDTAANSPVTIQETESTVSGDVVDELPLREKVPAANPAIAVSSDDDGTISELGLDEEEVARAREAELQAAAHSFGRLYAMGFDGKKVLLALQAANGNDDLAVEYLLNGVPQDQIEGVDLGSGTCTQDQETIKDHRGGDHREFDQGQREQQVVLRTRRHGFDEEEIEHILEVFRQDRMAALDLELAGPSSAQVVAHTTPIPTNATPPPSRPILTPHLFAMHRSPTVRLDTLSPMPSTPTLASAPTSGVSKPDYISPFTNGYVPTSPVLDPRLTNQPPTKKRVKRPRDRSTDTAAPRKKQKKRRRAPTPPRYKGLTRKENLRRRFGEDSEREKPYGVSREWTMVEAKHGWREWTVVEAKHGWRGEQW